MSINPVGLAGLTAFVVLGQAAPAQKPGISSPYFRALKFQIDTEVDNLFKITDNKSSEFENTAKTVAKKITDLFDSYSLQPWMKGHLLMKLFEIGLNFPKTSSLVSDIRKQWGDIPKDSVGKVVISADICKALGLGDAAKELNAMPAVPGTDEDLGSYIREWLFALCDIKSALITKDRDAHVAARKSLAGVINKEGCKEKITKLALDAILESLDVQWDDEAQIGIDRAAGLDISNKWIALSAKGPIPLSESTRTALGLDANITQLMNIPPIPKSDPNAL